MSGTIPVVQILTGKPGQEERFHSMKPLDLAACTRADIIAYFENTYDFDENLFLCLKDPNSLFLSPNRLRLPLIFYYCHTAVVLVNKLFIAGFLEERVNFEYETLFETGVDEMSWDDVDNFRMGNELKWPPLESIVEYRRKVRNLVIQTINNTPLELPITWGNPWWPLLLGIDHSRIHIELSSVMLHELPVELLHRPEAWSYGPVQPKTPIKENIFVTVPRGKVKLGKPREFPGYGWDNEFGSEEVEISPFKATQYLITNAEFLEFVEARGYETKEYWSDEGWDWVSFSKPRHPHFWVCQQGCISICHGKLRDYSHCKPHRYENGNSDKDSPASPSKVARSTERFQYRAMFDNIEMPWSWPVEANYLEAKAYCKWKGDCYRLPTEAEHHLMRGRELPAEEGNKSDPAFNEKPPFNSNLQFCSSTPVNYFPPSDAGFYDAYGNVWDWTECHFNGFKEFETHKVYDDFSSPCFDGRHNIIMGGSWVSSGTSASRFGRYSFRRHFFQHAGFRLVEALDKEYTPARICSTRPYILGLGFVENPSNVWGLEDGRNIREGTNPQLKTDLDDAFELELKRSKSEDAIILQRIRKLEKSQSFIHLGCGLGNICFDLSRDFNSVLGIDYSGRFIDSCLKVKSSSNNTPLVIASGINRGRLQFKQFTWLSNEIPRSDFVLVTLLDRVMNPDAWTLKLFELVKIGSTVLVVSQIKLAYLEKIMLRFQNKTVEMPFEDKNTILSSWERVR